MFLSVLLPFVDRGAGPLHHWVMLAQMSRFQPDDIIFISDNNYFVEECIPAGELLNIGGVNFECPSIQKFREFRKMVLSEDVFTSITNSHSSHYEIFKEILTKTIAALTDSLDNTIKQCLNQGPIEAILSWCNFPSLEAVAKKYNIPIIYNEVGPLRGDMYENTFYFDFSGVNGRSTPAAWNYDEIVNHMQSVDLLTANQIRGILVANTPKAEDILLSTQPSYQAGVALQVEDDSNIVAYSNGWDSVSLLYDVMSHVSPDQILVRPHPNAHFSYKGGLGILDTSIESLEFIAKVKKVISINSSVSIEAALWGKDFECRGDSPLKFLSAEERKKSIPALNAFFLGYLVPSKFLFDAEYYRWRLAGATLADCHRHHVSALHKEKEISLEINSEPISHKDTARLLRMLPQWTSSLSIDRQLRNIKTELESIRASFYQKQASLEAALKLSDIEKLHWKSEAERNWLEIEKLKTEINEMKKMRKEIPKN